MVKNANNDRIAMGNIFGLLLLTVVSGDVCNAYRPRYGMRGNTTLGSGASMSQSSSSNATATSAGTRATMQSNATTTLNNRISMNNNVGPGSIYSNVSMGNASMTIAPTVTNVSSGGTMSTAGATGNTMSSSSV